MFHMAKKQGGLGKGLDKLFIESGVEEWEKSATPKEITSVRLSDIEPDKAQPRKKFDDEALKALSESILAHGVLQPIVVRSAARPEDDDRTKALLAGKYRIISGERRWRASKLAGLDEIPVVIKELSDTEAGAVMLVENLQREDLNPVETARGLRRLIEEFGLTHEETAKIVGISRPNLTNSLRLLALPENVLDFLESGELSAGHARALLPLENETRINETMDIVLAKQLSVRETEKLVKNLLLRDEQVDLPEEKPVLSEKKIYMEKLEEKISSKLGRKAFLNEKNAKKGSGKLEIEYYGSEDLESLLKALCGTDIFDEFGD